ncbi:glycosyltransferase [Marinobacter sp. BGYM27]|uniref:glycosyltransferase n=1 Tax=Marinobacter sp. BGYM27 TaxID=2975597 RepID=UPI0021A70477|nr:glycosyltransferase [Marinobacter sp. BGYM27]MDG5499007.1 glycosyltransferase [Marinobacter sp. BGYM27]
MIDSPYVSVIVPIYNEEKYVRSCLESLFSQCYPKDRYEIIVVDNGSTDDTHQILDDIGIDYKVFMGGKVGAVRNYGESLAKGDIVCFLDADCVAPLDWIVNGVKNLQAPEIGATGGAYLLRSNPNWVEKSWVIKTPVESEVVDHLVGGSLFLRRSDFNDLGGFDEKINAGEDTKLSHEISKRGYVLYQDTKLAVTHLGYPTNIFDFLKRQFWHSSSFFKSKKSWRDRTFLLTLVFSVSFALFILLSIFSLYFYSLFCFLFFVFVPVLFTVKKVWSVGVADVSLNVLFGALFLNFLYFFSRSLGMWIGLAFDPFKK